MISAMRVSHNESLNHREAAVEVKVQQTQRKDRKGENTCKRERRKDFQIVWEEEKKEIKHVLAHDKVAFVLTVILNE